MRTSQTTHEGSTASEGLSEQSVPLLTAQEIKQLGDEDVIGFHRRLPPFQAKRMDWRRFPVLERRRRLPASRFPELPTLERLPPTARWGRDRLAYIDPDMALGTRPG